MPKRELNESVIGPGPERKSRQERREDRKRRQRERAATPIVTGVPTNGDGRKQPRNVRTHAGRQAALSPAPRPQIPRVVRTSDVSPANRAALAAIPGLTQTKSGEYRDANGKPVIVKECGVYLAGLRPPVYRRRYV